MSKRRRPPIRITDPAFEYVPSAVHLDGSDAFRARQRARRERMQEKPANVQAIKSRRTA